MSTIIGMDQTISEDIGNAIKPLLADTFVLYVKTLNYHWNVTGSDFVNLHQLFENHYTELSSAIDEIAERIRTLGISAPGTMQEFMSLTNLKEDKTIPNSQTMVKNLLEDHQSITKACYELIGSDTLHLDEVTTGLLSDRMAFHEKTSWMLKSLLT